MAQFQHENSLLGADLTSAQNELARARADLVFLSGAVREMVTHEGKIGRTRLSETMRICTRVRSLHGGGSGGHKAVTDGRVDGRTAGASAAGGGGGGGGRT